jgi:predicted CoA-binding protein
MTTVAEAAADFLAQRRIAVAGVSRQAAGHGGNTVYTTLRKRGYEVFAVNPNADSVEGDRCYHSLAEIPGGVDGVVIATNPIATASVVDECIRLGLRRVWMHRSFGGGSVDRAAAEAGRAAGLTVIAGACPLMFGEQADFGHKCMRWFQGLTGSRPTAG